MGRRHQYEAAARQSLVNTLARNSEAHNYNVQIQVRQVEQEADARFSQRLRELLFRCSQGANQALEDQREILVMEVTKEVWRRDDQVHSLRTELSLQTPHSGDVSKQPKIKAGLHQHLTRLIQETKQYREMFEESRTAYSAAGPEIDRHRQREE